MKNKSNSQPLRKIDYRQLLTLIVAVGLILLCVDISLNNYWDPLLVSGIIVFLIAIQMAFQIQSKFNEMLNRLVHRDTLESNEKKLGVLKADLQNGIRRLSIIIGMLLAVSLLFSFLYRSGTSFIARIPITLLESAGGFIAGTLLGQMCGYGRLGSLLKKHHITLKIQPGHLDGVGGLKPVGEFYFNQAMVVAMPAVFLSVWLLLFQFGFAQYSRWKTPYAILLIINVVLEILAFVAPLLSFHKIMTLAKQNELEAADKLSNEIAIAEHQLTKEQDASKRELIKDRLSSMTKEYWSIEKLPTWPISKRTKKLFTRNNLTLLVPLIIDLIGRTSVGQTSWWHDVSRIIEKATN